MNMKKDFTRREVCLTRYLEWRENHANVSLVFTDASVEEEAAVAAAVSSHQNQYSDMFRITLSANISASTAEMYAIYRAVKSLDGQRDVTTVLSDSLGSIEAVFNPVNRSYMPTYVRKTLLLNGGVIKLGWVAGHVGIEGNERADTLAKRRNDEDIVVFRRSKVACRGAAMTGEMERRRLAWTLSGTFLGQHWGGPGPPKIDPTLSIGQACTLTRCRLEHTRLIKGYLLDRTEPPQCGACQMDLTIPHILGDCRLTRDYFRGRVPELGVLLDPEQNGDSPLFRLLTHLGYLHFI